MSASVWEYRVVNQNDSPLENQAELNRLGQEGWELVAVSALGSAGPLAAYLKRLRDGEDLDPVGCAEGASSGQSAFV